MGGHGGLNILPQKKWNVYNWDNRQIVQKDKKLHAEKQRKKFENERQSKLQGKIAILRQQAKLPQYKTEQEKPKHSLVSQQMKKLADMEKHINLFQQEQKIIRNRQIDQIKRLKQQQFLKDKNMDLSTRFLGSYNDKKYMPWYSKKKGQGENKKINKNFIQLDDIIYTTRTDSKITKEVVQFGKKHNQISLKQQERDRTRQKIYKKYEQYEDKYAHVDTKKTLLKQQIKKHEQNLMMQQFKNDKQAQLQKQRQKRLKRQEKQRKRAEELKKLKQNNLNQ